MKKSTIAGVYNLHLWCGAWWKVADHGLIVWEREAASSWFGEEDRGLHWCIFVVLLCWERRRRGQNVFVVLLCRGCCYFGEEEEDRGQNVVLLCWGRRRNKGQGVWPAGNKLIYEFIFKYCLILLLYIWYVIPFQFNICNLCIWLNIVAIYNLLFLFKYCCYMSYKLNKT